MDYGDDWTGTLKEKMNEIRRGVEEDMTWTNQGIQPYMRVEHRWLIEVGAEP